MFHFPAIEIHWACQHIEVHDSNYTYIKSISVPKHCMKFHYGKLHRCWHSWWVGCFFTKHLDKWVTDSVRGAEERDKVLECGTMKPFFWNQNRFIAQSLLIILCLVILFLICSTSVTLKDQCGRLVAQSLEQLSFYWFYSNTFCIMWRKNLCSDILSHGDV